MNSSFSQYCLPYLSDLIYSSPNCNVGLMCALWLSVALDMWLQPRGKKEDSIQDLSCGNAREYDLSPLESTSSATTAVYIYYCIWFTWWTVRQLELLPSLTYRWGLWWPVLKWLSKFPEPLSGKGMLKISIPTSSFASSVTLSTLLTLSEPKFHQL